MAKAISYSNLQDPEQRKEDLAVLEGHDADFPTEDQASQPASHPPSLRSAVSRTSLESSNGHSHDPLPPDAAEKQALAVHQDNEKLQNGKATEASGFEKDIELEAGRKSDSVNDKKDTDFQPHTTDPIDPNIVDWDGPNDPENPINWTTGRKWSNIAIMAAITFLTYVVLVIS